MRRGLLLVCLPIAACATTQAPPGRTMMLGYTDHKLFAIEHHDPIHGGRIIGNVCAVDVQLEAQPRRDGVVVRGLVDDRHGSSEGMSYVPMGRNMPGAWTPDPAHELPYYIEVHDHPWQAAREIVGSVGDAEAQPDRRISAPHSVDLTLTREAIRGQVGARQFDLQARGDDYVGGLQLNQAKMPFVLRGLSELWAMPAAAQASILPLLLTCTEPTKVIQIVDLRESDTPPPSPPRWLAPLPQTAPPPSQLVGTRPPPAAPTAPVAPRSLFAERPPAR